MASGKTYTRHDEKSPIGRNGRFSETDGSMNESIWFYLC